MTEEKKPLPHEVLIGLMKDAQKDFREMIGAVKELNETIQNAMLYVGGTIEEEKPKSVEEEDAEGIEE